VSFKLLAAVALATAAAGCGNGDADDRSPAATQTAAAARAQPGRTVWVAQGCGTCHTLQAGGSTSTIGPDLDETLKGKPDEYIHEAIVAPLAAAAPGFEGQSGLMPDDYARRIEPDELRALVAWIARSVGAQVP
jgi:mono/diheme cytochrome c family protein